VLAGIVLPLRSASSDSSAPPATASWFRETRPAPGVATAVVARWAGVGGWDRTLRVLPDGCADLIWAGDRLVVVGAQAGPQRFAVSAAGHNVGLRLRPGAGRAVLGVALRDLPPGEVAAVDLWGSAATRLEDDLHHARDVGHRHELLERHVAARLAAVDADDGRGLDPAVAAAAQLLRHAATSVARVADDVGLSPRELRRRFLVDVGYGPKTLQRVLRFRAAVRNLSTGVSLADIAARHGYADQSHLGRECRRLSGSSPARLQALRGRLGRNVPDPGAATGAG